MRRVALVFVLLASLATVPAAAAAAPATTRVIVQFTGTGALAAGTQAHQRTTALQAEHASFARRADVKITHDFTQALNAVAVTTDAAGAARLRAVPGVAAVYPDQAMHASVDADVSLINAPQVWQTRDSLGKPVEGGGETVAVVDTGIDYTHPDLGGGFGRGYKVVGGYDFVNGDADPMDDNGHGTHVAGIVAGEGTRTGVAPKAELTAYKVLDSSGNGYESTVIAGLEAAVATDNPHRADIVNMSLSGPSTVDDPLEQASENAIHAGVVVVAAAGNDGPGESTVGSPAEAPDVLAVGASISGIEIPTISVTTPVQHALSVQRLDLSANPPATPRNLDLIDVGNGQPSDYDGVDATGKAVLVSYNAFLLTQALLTAEQHGAAAVLLSTPNYYSGTGTQPGPLPDVAAGTPDDPDKLDIVATVITGTDATDLRQWLGDGAVHIRVGGADATDEIAAFSAHGPAPHSYALKPDLVAPGVEIGSTWPGGQYRDDSGTSMAAPHVAGAAALLREAHPTWTATQVGAALTGGAKLLPGYDATTQGAGRLDVAAADRVTVLPDQRVANLGLADLRHPSVTATTTVTFTNVSTKSQLLRLDAQPAAGSAGHAFVTPAVAWLAPGKRLTARLTVTGPKPSESADLTGWVRATASGSPTVSVPYLLAVRPLDLHADPDPTVSGATVYVHAEPDVVAAPTVTVTGPAGRATSTAILDHTGWWRVTVPAGPAGTYRVTATVPATDGATLAGTTSFEELGSQGPGWQQVGPDSQGAYEMAFTSQPGRMFAMPGRSPHAGLFRTDDGGSTWQELRRLPVGDGVDMGLATDPTQPGTVYLAVEGGADPTYKGRLLASHDAGATWTTLPFPDVAMHDLSIDATGRILTVPAFNGNVYVSTDRGQTWNAYPSPGGYPQQTRVVGHDLYIADGADLYVVRDVDGSPQPAQKIFSAPIWYQSVLDVVGDGNVVLARTAQQVFASRDGGATWQTLFTPPDDDPFLSSVQIVHGDIYVAGGSHIWVDHGEGADWTPMPAPVDQDTFFVGTWDPAGTQLVVSAENTGMFVTSDAGASYHRVGLAGADVHALVVDQDAAGQTALLAGTTYSVFSAPVPENTVNPDWGITAQQSAIGTRVVSLSVSPRDPRTVFSIVANAFSRINVQRSTDGGATWTTVEAVRSSSRGYQVLVDPADPDYVYATINDALSPGVLVSRDGGQTWRKNNLPSLVTAIAADPHDPSRIWLGGPSGLYRSDDQGQTMTRLSSTPVTALALDPHDSSQLVVGGSGLYTSRDGGRHLTAASTSGYPLSISALLFGSHGAVYAADAATTDGAGLPLGGRGVLASRDGGRSWQNISAGLANLDASSLALSPDGRWLYAGTGGGSVYRTRLD
ncbi:MAG TPA: S8 family serine peptidase [Jatrophihabitantaceae bacterium]|jgi:subtilisin family serine protease